MGATDGEVTEGGGRCTDLVVGISVTRSACRLEVRHRLLDTTLPLPARFGMFSLLLPYQGIKRLQCMFLVVIGHREPNKNFTPVASWRYVLAVAATD